MDPMWHSLCFRGTFNNTASPFRTQVLGLDTRSTVATARAKDHVTHNLANSMATLGSASWHHQYLVLLAFGN